MLGIEHAVLVDLDRKLQANDTDQWNDLRVEAAGVQHAELVDHELREEDRDFAEVVRLF